MAQIHIGRGTTNLGAFTEEEVREGLHSGRFLPTDLGWAEGMDNWKPLSDFPELTTVPGLSAPGAGSLPGQEGESVPREGLPWDDRETLGFVKAFIETMKLVLMEPAKAFSMMKREGGLGGPLTFAVASGWIGGAAALFYNFIWQMVLHHSMGSRAMPAGMPAIFSGAGITAVSLVFMLFFLPVFLVIGIFIGSGITHLCLMLLGCAKQPFETTFRVACFSIGATGLLQLLPLCGGYAYAIWNIVAQCIGISKAHEISTGKAVTAVLLPMAVCCCGVFLIAGTVGFAAARHLH